jgi:hypothetical protein
VPSVTQRLALLRQGESEFDAETPSSQMCPRLYPVSDGPLYTREFLAMKHDSESYSQGERYGVHCYLEGRSRAELEVLGLAPSLLPCASEPLFVVDHYFRQQCIRLNFRNSVHKAVHCHTASGQSWLQASRWKLIGGYYFDHQLIKFGA